MVVNNIMIKLKDVKDAEMARDMLEGMKGKIDTLLEAKAYINEVPRPVAYDLLYISKFADKEGQQQYVDHPVHVEVSAKLRELSESMIMVAYTE